MLADTILCFADAVEALIKDELAYPFSTIPSAALSDRAVDGEHVSIGCRSASPTAEQTGADARPSGQARRDRPDR